MMIILANNMSSSRWMSRANERMRGRNTSHVSLLSSPNTYYLNRGREKEKTPLCTNELRWRRRRRRCKSAHFERVRHPHVRRCHAMAAATIIIIRLKLIGQLPKHVPTITSLYKSDNKSLYFFNLSSCSIIYFTKYFPFLV